MEGQILRQPPYPASASLFPGSEQRNEECDFMRLPGEYCIAAADLPRYLSTELSVARLSKIHAFLWFAGRPSYVRPLHRQQLVQRTIVITEQADLHLVWYGTQIYIKPLPALLLCHGFFSRHICGSSLSADACGMLRSYTKLIQHESDYLVAIKMGLLPKHISWTQWSSFAVQVRSTAVVSKRYEYGELRLFRLNLIYRFCFGQWVCGYHLRHTNFNSFFGSNFTWPLVIFAYLTTVLNAMQVILAAKTPSERIEDAFIGAGFVVVLAILGTLCAVAVFFVALLLYHLAKALSTRDRKRHKVTECQKDCV